METLTEAMAKAMEIPLTKGVLAVKKNHHGNPKLSESWKKDGEKINRTQEEEAAILKAITSLCALQKQYGKTSAELEALLNGFLWLLDDVSTENILMAMKQYANSHNDIPTPADIRNIISPPPQPLSAAVYVKYQKLTRDGHILLSDERAYCRAYEAQEMAKARGGSEELRDAQKQIDHYTKQLEYYP